MKEKDLGHELGIQGTILWRKRWMTQETNNTDWEWKMKFEYFELIQGEKPLNQIQNYDDLQKRRFQEGPLEEKEIISEMNA